MSEPSLQPARADRGPIGGTDAERMDILSATIESMVRTSEMQFDQIERLITKIEALTNRISDIEDQLAELEERRR